MTGPTLVADLRLAAAAIDAGRVTDPVSLWRLGLAIRAAADRGLVREALPICVHRALVAIARALTAASRAPAPAEAEELGWRLWLLADVIATLQAGAAEPVPDAPGPEDFWP